MGKWILIMLVPSLAAADSFSKGAAKMQPVRMQPVRMQNPSTGAPALAPVKIQNYDSQMLKLNKSAFENKPIKVAPAPANTPMGKMKIEKWKPVEMKKTNTRPQNVGEKEALTGYIYSDGDRLYMSENPNSTFPVYNIEFADLEKRLKVCHYQKNPNCPKYRARFEKIEGRPQIVELEEVPK